MKKILKTLIISSSIIIGMTSCFDSGNSENSYSSLSETIYEKLNNLASINYKTIKLDVTTSVEDITLYANFTINQDNVSYSIEQLNKLPTDGNLEDYLNEYKSVYTGQIEISDNNVIEVNGVEITLPTYNELKGNFNFESDNFIDVYEEEGLFSAKVVSPSIFYGSSVNVQDMNVNVKYTNDALKEILITYQTDYSKVTSLYEFII